MFNFEKDYFESVLANMNEEVYFINDNYKITYVNKTASDKLFNGKNVINQSIFDAFPSITMDNSMIVSVFKTGKPIIKKITTFICNNGKRRVTLTSTVPIKRDGKVVNVFEISEDITGLSNMSEKLVSEVIRDNKSSKVVSKGKNSFYNLDSIIGISDAMKTLKEQIVIYSKSPSNLMIYGETGTGKEIVAQAVYSLSHDVKKEPFIAQNCAAIPESLLETILFGSVKGAFTGAETRPGLFELASGGVLFLDEINSMPKILQAKILRVLQEGKIRRVGGQDEIDVDFRLISSTNVSPKELLSSGEFRQDLFFRLNILYIEIPPLRKRKEDIPVLVDYFINEFNDKLNKNIVCFDDKSMNFFMKNYWAGNVRELKNIVERSMNMAAGTIIRYEEIQLPEYCSVGEIEMKNEQINSYAYKSDRVRLKETIQDIEMKIIKDALLKFSGNASKAARELDIPQQTINNKIDKYRLRSYVHNIKNPKMSEN